MQLTVEIVVDVAELSEQEKAKIVYTSDFQERGNFYGYPEWFCEEKTLNAIQRGLKGKGFKIVDMTVTDSK